jgi:hypothetical protein
MTRSESISGHLYVTLLYSISTADENLGHLESSCCILRWKKRIRGYFLKSQLLWYLRILSRRSRKPTNKKHVAWGALWKAWGALWKAWGALWKAWGVLWKAWGALWKAWGALWKAWGALWKGWGALWKAYYDSTYLSNIIEVTMWHLFLCCGFSQLVEQWVELKLWGEVGQSSIAERLPEININIVKIKWCSVIYGSGPYPACHSSMRSFGDGDRFSHGILEGIHRKIIQPTLNPDARRALSAAARHTNLQCYTMMKTKWVGGGNLGMSKDFYGYIS